MFEARLLERLEQAVRRGGGRPVATKRLTAELDRLDMWNVWYHLRRLEEQGLVHRPEGQGGEPRYVRDCQFVAPGDLGRGTRYSIAKLLKQSTRPE